MKLNEGRPAGTQLIRRYGGDGVTLVSAANPPGGTVLTEQTVPLPLLVTPVDVDTGFESPSLAELSASDIERVIARRPAIVLGGSASGSWQAPSSLRQAFESRNIAFEAMDIGAACRTFNVLVQEDREVVALLFP